MGNKGVPSRDGCPSHWPPLSWASQLGQFAKGAKVSLVTLNCLIKAFFLACIPLFSLFDAPTPQALQVTPLIMAPRPPLSTRFGCCDCFSGESLHSYRQITGQRPLSGSSSGGGAQPPHPTPGSRLAPRQAGMCTRDSSVMQMDWALGNRSRMHEA